jgi:hypothetical protein
MAPQWLGDSGERAFVSMELAQASHTEDPLSAGWSRGRWNGETLQSADCDEATEKAAATAPSAVSQEP